MVRGGKWGETMELSIVLGPVKGLYIKKIIKKNKNPLCKLQELISLFLCNFII